MRFGKDFVSWEQDLLDGQGTDRSSCELICEHSKVVKVRWYNGQLAPLLDGLFV